MGIELEEEKKKIELQKRKLLLKEKLLKEKERQRKFRRISQIVEIAFKVNLDEIEDGVLLGAFLEIAENRDNPLTVEKWKRMGEQHLKKEEGKPEHLLAISFRSEPQKDIRDQLKKMRFRWNNFRKEFCGYGNQRELENLLKESEVSIEIIP